MNEDTKRPRASDPPRHASGMDSLALQAPTSRGAGVDVPRVAVLGLNLWAVLLAIPLGSASGPAGMSRILSLLAPLVVLAAGTFALHLALPKTPRPDIRLLARRHTAATWLLIAGFPAAVAAVVAVRPELRGLDAYSPVGLVLGALSLAAFGGAASAAVARPRATRRTTRQPLASPPAPLPGAAKRSAARWLLLGASASGALALVAIAPALGGRAEVERAWGDAAAEGALLAAVAGSALATLVLSVFVGPALRAERARTAPTPRLRRVPLALLVVTSGVVAYVLYKTAR